MYICMFQYKLFISLSRGSTQVFTFPFSGIVRLYY